MNINRKYAHSSFSCLLKISLLLLILFTPFWANAQQQNKTITLTGTNITIKEALSQVEKQTGMSVGYDESILDIRKVVKKSVRNSDLKNALTAILEGTSCTYTLNGNYILIVKVNENIKISGKITDEKGEEIIGASIRAVGTSIGTISDYEGNFALEVPAKSRLEVSYIGYVSENLNINSPADNLKVILREDAKTLDEVVVIGYGTRSKRDVTTAISTMSADKIAKNITMSPEMAMQGQMSGVQVSGNQGDPNARPTIRIRGTNTWGVADPLYVVDGVPIKEFGAGIEGEGSAGQYMRGNINIMSMIDANDIESISILKDAASAAIYGVRAANGVVLITTKKGKREKPQVEYSHKIGIQNQNKRVDLMNTQQYADYFYNFFRTDPNWLNSMDAANLLVFDPTRPQYLGGSPTYDWQSASLKKDALSQDYSMRVSGGTEKADYSASFSYANQDGVRVGTNMERYSGAFKLNVDLNKYVRTGVNLRISYGTGSSFGAPSLIEAAMTPPWQPIYDENGLNGYAGVVEGYRQNGTWNPSVKYGSMTRNNFLGQLSERDENNESLRLLGNAYLEIEPIKGLKLKGTINLDYFTNNIYTFEGFEGSIFQYNGSNPTQQPTGSVGSYEERTTTNNNRIGEFTANYARSIDKHNLDVLFNMMAQKYSAKYARGRTEYMTTSNPDLRNLGGENQYTSVTSTRNRGSLVGMLWRVGYNYDYKYYVDATLRRDGSSRFAPSKRWGIFPGVSVAWRISSESFLKEESWIDDIKLRASWGKLGNQEVSEMAFLSAINVQANYAFGNNPANLGYGYYSTGATVYGMANESLTWEKTTTKNIGVDFAFLQGLNGSFEYYHKMTDGILQTVSLPPSVGILDQPVDNIAAVKNTGIELNLNYTRSFNDFTFSVGGNFTTVRNRVVTMYDGIPIGQIEEGYSMNYIRGYVLGGMFQSREEAVEYMERVKDLSYKEQQVQGGDFWFKDMRGAPNEEDIANGGNRFYSVGADGIIDDYDRVFLGKTIPGYFYGLNLSLEYKGFDLSAQFTGVGDVQKVNNVKRTFLNTSQVAVNQSPEILNAWREDNTNTTIPRVRFNDPAGNNRFSSYFVENGDYFRLSNLQIGYTLPKAVYRATGNILNYARVYFGGTNLFTLTKYGGLDPEDDYNPAPVMFYTGLSLRF